MSFRALFHRTQEEAVKAAVAGLAALPSSLPSAAERLAWLPTPILLSLYVGYVRRPCSNHSRTQSSHAGL